LAPDDFPALSAVADNASNGVAIPKP